MRAHRIPLDGLSLESRHFPAQAATRTPYHHPGRLLSKGEYLYHADDILRTPQIVTSGALKGFSIDPDGNECVLRLYSEGDLIGLEALARRPALMSVIALSTVRVSTLSEHAASITESGTQPGTDALLTCVYQELRQATRILEMNRGPTEARLARFLLQYGDKQALRGCKRHEFLLPFGRRDLAHYLGLATETLSRVFARLQKRRILDVDSHHIVVLDLDALRRVASESTFTTAATVERHASGE
ncbi:Crp/Fnr family transcriptional regulator [Aquisalimonas sp.]|uniref:Crp/Fnr family transcriptional regulator n=1 Tax=unclassified Aquisalimonas TaxID=2644645 RepID=UPI0025B8177A|nr:Crp/Fnr family transcriptional regulator [Aquisalimonas sp.]